MNERGDPLGSREAWHTEREVAEIFHVTQRTVSRWIAKGVLGAHRFGGTVRISDGNISAMIEQCKM